MADLLPAPQIPVGFDPQHEDSGMIAPGQEEMAQQFLSGESAEEDQGEAQIAHDKLLGKFDSVEDLQRAYQELERKQSQQLNSDPESSSQSQNYTAEQAVSVYGQAIFDSVAEAGLDMAVIMQKADQGADVSEHYDALAQAVGVPRGVVETFIANNQAKPASSAELSAADEASIISEVGGQDSFNALSGWAKENLEQGDLDDYNSVVNSGNKDAIRWALKAMQAKSIDKAQAAEPRLIRGQAPAGEERRFRSQGEVLEAMNKRDSRGRKLIEVDSEYQRKFAALLDKSDVFG